METMTTDDRPHVGEAPHALDRIPVPVHSMGPDGLLHAVNKAWVNFTGYTPEQALGQSFANFLEKVSAQRYRDAAVPEMIGQVADGEVRLVEYTMLRASGEAVDIVIAAQPIRDADGRFLHSFAVITDITARNLAEQALRHAQKLEAIGALTSGIAHDFNNLLTIVQNSLYLLGRYLPGGNERAALLLDAALQGARRGAVLTARLLAFAHEQDLAPQPVSVPSLLVSLRPMLKQLLGSSIAIRYELPSALVTLHADPHQLELVLINLAANARDAMPAGGVLTISARQHTLGGRQSAFIASPSEPAVAKLLDGGSYVVVAVTDTGTGMDAAVLARAADPFFTTKGVGKGTGLGLSMVHGFAKQSGGAFHLESRLGHGTTAELWLPSTSEAAAAGTVDFDSKVDVPVRANTRVLRVLIVDDDALVLASAVAFIEHLGYASVHAVTSGKDALSVLRDDHGFDLLLTDYMMPDISGTVLAAEARALHPGIAILIVSGFADRDDLSSSGWPLLRKPYSLEQLDSALISVANARP